MKSEFPMKNYLLIVKRCTLFIIAVLFCSIQPLKAQLTGKYKGYEQKYYKGVRYGLFKPASYTAGKSYPLVVYLHGSTDTVSRDISYYQESVQKDNPCFVLTPKCEVANLGWGDTWHNSHSETTAKVLALVDSLVKTYNIDKDRLYIFGISMGGFGVFSVLTKEEGKFAAGYAICGGSDTKVADKLLKTPLWIFHGSADDVVPTYLSRDIYKEIVRLGGKNVKYTEYPGVKHNSWENVGREKSVIPWLFAQRKGKATSFPDN
jgi:predicted peptidase